MAALLPVACSERPASGAAPDPAAWHFSHARPGPFVAGVVQAGTGVRTQVTAGWGQPHWLWVDVSAQTAVTFSAATAGAGLRLGAPFGEIDLVGRRVASYERRFLLPASSYGDDQLTSGSGNRAAYGMLEPSLTLYVPAVVGVVFVSAWVDRLVGVPDGKLVYDEIDRAVVKGPWEGSEQLAWLSFLDAAHRHRIGPIAEHVWSGRGGGDVVRLGLAYSARFTAHLTLFAYLTEPVVSPDALGLFDGAGGLLWLAYDWSSTDPKPQFP